MLRRPWFWIVLVLASAACAALAVKIFPRAFPLVSLDIKMDRAHAVASARALASSNNWGPAGPVRDAVSFGGDGAAQSFVELAGGGQPAFAALLHDDIYSPYAWHVRLFKESETQQVVVNFKPSGEPYAFDETLREKAAGAALSADAARAIAERAATAAPWNIPLTRFTFAEKSQIVRPGGRVDHTFVYERPDRPLGDGRLRLRLVVSGDRLTSINHFVKIPEAFTRRYEEMRSANNAIAAGASILMVVGYLLGGCGVGLAFLIRQRAVLWRQPLAWACAIAALQLAAAINAWPLQWLSYDTALSGSSFITQRLIAVVASVLALGFVFFISFLAAEGLSRRAFPEHPQLWKIWSRDAAPTRAVLGRTLAGYLVATVALLYVSVFYYFASRRFGWWSPSEALVNPDSLAHYWPWLTPFAQAAQAGFWEETLFRAVPLAGAALLGARFGGRRWWIAAAFILQAIVFSAAHANYPGQPAYSRVVELLIPSFIFGALYLRFGLLPAIVLHFTYDVALMSLPLFASSADGIWIDRVLIVLLSLVPLWIVLWRRWRAGAWLELPATFRNLGWQAPVATPAEDEPASIPVSLSVSKTFTVIVAVAGILGAVTWIAILPMNRLDSALTISRTEAITRAQQELTRRGTKLPPTYRADAMVPDRPWAVDRFVWQTTGHDAYKTVLGSYVPGARWLIRFATFEGNVAERAEQWSVFLMGDGQVQRLMHNLPEARAGTALTEQEARARVHAVVREKWNLDPTALIEISATSGKRPNRIDWTFVLKDPSVKALVQGEARLQIVLAGDEVTDAFRFVFMPEDWERDDRALHTKFNLGRILKSVTIAILMLAGIAAAIVAWSRNRFDVRVALITAGGLATASLLSALNHWPVVRAGFSTAQPLQLQQVMALVGTALQVLLSGASIGLLAGYVVRKLPPPLADERQATVLASSIAAAVVGGLALTGLPRMQVAPAWPSLANAATFFPWLATLSAVVGQLVAQSVVLLLLFGFLNHLTRGWQRKRLLASALLFLVAAILLISWGDVSVASWLGTDAAAALLVVLAYVVVLRRDLTMVPLACGVSGAFSAVAAGIPRGYPGALTSGIFAAVLFIVLGWWITSVLRRLARARTAQTPLATQV